MNGADVIAETVQFIGPRDADGGGGGGGAGGYSGGAPVAAARPQPAAVPASDQGPWSGTEVEDDDIPF